MSSYKNDENDGNEVKNQSPSEVLKKRSISDESTDISEVKKIKLDIEVDATPKDLYEAVMDCNESPVKELEQKQSKEQLNDDHYGLVPCFSDLIYKEGSDEENKTRAALKGNGKVST